MTTDRHAAELTRRQLEILRLVADGLWDVEIGKRLWLSVSTVKSHIKAANAALGARNRTHAVGIAYRTGLLPTDRERALLDQSTKADPLCVYPDGVCTCGEPEGHQDAVSGPLRSTESAEQPPGEGADGSEGAETRSGELRGITYEVPVIHTTVADFCTDLFWATQVDPVAKLHGLDDYQGLHNDPGDYDQYLLKDRDGVILLVVRTDRPEGA